MTNQDHSYWYNKLTDEQKVICDAILTFLTGQNAAVAKRILDASSDEITYQSTINS